MTTDNEGHDGELEIKKKKDLSSTQPIIPFMSDK